LVESNFLDEKAKLRGATRGALKEPVKRGLHLRKKCTFRSLGTVGALGVSNQQRFQPREDVPGNPPLLSLVYRTGFTLRVVSSPQRGKKGRARGWGGA